jgi:hypothetical protein
VNAVDRLWVARAHGDWDSLATLLRPGMRITMLHEDQELGRDEFLTFLRLLHLDSQTIMHRNITGRGLEISVLAEVRRPRGTLMCAGYYELREGLIDVVDEAWMVPGSVKLLQNLGG